MKEITHFVDGTGINIICTKEDSDDLIPTPEEQWEYWIKPCLESYLTDSLFKERGVNLAVTKVLEDIIFQAENESFLKTGCFDRLCGHGANMIAIDPNLKVYNCDKYLEEGPYISSREGHDLNQRDFLGLQQINNVVQYYREVIKLEKKTGCDFCKAKQICNGECQSYMLSKYGEYRLNPGMCEIYKKAYDFISNNWLSFIKHEFHTLKNAQNIRPEALKALENANMKIYVDQERKVYKGVEK